MTHTTHDIAGPNARPGEHWDLLYRALCESRDRRLFTPLSIGDSMANCSRSARIEAFDAERWRATGAEQRGEMVADLFCEGILLGLNESEVEQLLGRPDERDGPKIRYRVKMNVDWIESRYVPPRRDNCRNEGWYELTFDFSIEAPEEQGEVFGMLEMCGVDA